ncbi:MAG: zinc ribbon domain-containing protein [candidate division NC10 bacterium]|nr:zinc ribbon domain-containing protein [candidate division NC10 bacterium]MBI3086899.1 zinc ribbon domain-containing protein [candidate division NC10 bacterium]
MPIYEYHCEDCRRRVSILIRSISNPGRPTCPRCGGHRLERLMSRFARLRSEDDRLDALADPSSFGDLDENDPKSIARFAKKMGGELGEDLGEDFDQVMEEALEEEAAGAGKSADGGDDLDDL